MGRYERKAKPKMCYPCLNYCENCKQKYLFCPECGAQNLVIRKDCLKCGHVFTVDDLAEGVRQWKIRTKKIEA